MIEKISHDIVKQLFKNRTQDKLEIYEYGLTLFLTTLLGYVSIIILSAFLFSIAEGALFLLVFSVLRAFSGGYHCKTYIGCFVVSNGIFLLNCVVANSINNLPIIIQGIFIILSATIIIYVFVRFSPFIPINHYLSPKQVLRNRQLSILTATIILTLAIFFSIVSIVQTSTIPGKLIVVISTELSVAVLIVISKLSERRKKNEQFRCNNS